MLRVAALQWYKSVNKLFVLVRVCVFMASNELQHFLSSHSCSYSTVENWLVCSKKNVLAIQILQQYWGWMAIPPLVCHVYKKDKNKHAPGHNWQKRMTGKKNMHEFKARRIQVFLDHISVFINPYKYFGVNMTPINFSLVKKKWFPSSQWNKILLLFYIIYLYSYKKPGLDSVVLKVCNFFFYKCVLWGQYDPNWKWMGNAKKY